MWATSFPPKHRKTPTYNIHECFWIHSFRWHTSWIHISLEQIRHQNQKPHLHSVGDNPHAWQDPWHDPTSAFIGVFFLLLAMSQLNPNVSTIYSFKNFPTCSIQDSSPKFGSKSNKLGGQGRKSWKQNGNVAQDVSMPPAPPTPPKTHSHQPSASSWVEPSLTPPGEMRIWDSP